MRKLFLSLLILLPVLLFAQKGVVKGIVEDSVHRFALQSATVTIYKKADSALINYQITNNQGEFNIGDLPLGTLLLVSVSYTGYLDFSRELRLDSLKQLHDFKKISLLRDTAKHLEEVIVKAVVPVKMNGDTLEINPGAFKMDSSAVVEDMLLRVPGVTMWSDGTITVNGKKVNNVYVDGKAFFGNNPELATQNLPKNAIEKIQVYKEKDYSKQDLTNTDLDSTVTMNIKLRPDKKKGYFGKVSAGIGSDNRYEGDLSLQLYDKKNKIGIAGNLNNTNKTVQSVQEAMQNNTFHSYNRRNFGTPNASMNGLNTVHYFGAYAQHSFNETTNSRFDNSLNGDYSWRESNGNITRNSTTIQQNVPDVDPAAAPFKLTTYNNQHNLSNTLDQSVNTGYNNRKRATSLSLNASYNWSNGNTASNSVTHAFKNDTTAASNGTSSTVAQSRSNNLNVNGYFNNNDYDEGINKKSFSTNYSISYGSSQSDSKKLTDFESLVGRVYEEKYDRKYHNDNSNFTTNLGLSYNGLRSLLFGSYNFWNINIGLRNNFRYNKSDLNAIVSDRDTLTNTYKINDTLTNNNSVVNIENRPGISFFKTVSKFLSDRYYKSLTARVDLQDQIVFQKNTSTLSYRNIERNYSFFTPAASLYYSYNRFNKYNLNIGLNQSSSATAPTIDQLYPIVDSSNKYNIVKGNPYLKSAFGNNYNLSANYNTQKFNEKNTYTASLNLGYSNTRNAISDSSFILPNGGRRSSLINVDNRTSYNASLNGSASYRINKNMIQVRYNGGYNTTSSYQYLNTYKTPFTNENINNSLNLFYSAQEIFNITIGESLTNTNTITTDTVGQKHPLKSKTYSTRANFNLTVPKNFMLSSNINYLNNISATNQSVKATIWNASVTYRFLKMKTAEVKFSVFDILHQNKNIDNFANNNMVRTTISNGLQQFYMLSLTYYPRKFGGKEKGGRRNSGQGQGGIAPSSAPKGMRGMGGGQGRFRH
ncbi:MAG: outer membrane beta-barrel protein [Niabella sp.]|nr:outer membrane beta-barrel protein [Niabella sp.]